MACITLLRKSCNWSQEILFCWSSEFRLMMEFSSIVRISRIWVGCDNFRFSNFPSHDSALLTKICKAIFIQITLNTTCPAIYWMTSTR
jgi:hypothetical protein